MSFKCLNCKTVCSPSDPYCPFCHSKISNTASELKMGLSSSKGTGLAIIAIVIGTCVFNTMIGPKYFPRGGSEMYLAAAGFGAVCAVFGAILGWVMSD